VYEERSVSYRPVCTSPNLNICLAHGGGPFPILLGRIRHGVRVRRELHGTTANTPLDLAKRFYYESLTRSERTLHFLVEMVGCDRILLGSDHPFDMRDPDPISEANSLVRPTQENVDGIFGGIAATFLKL
jgi:aminocarboxymuconate-semialdehyde decarboxylase